MQNQLFVSGVIILVINFFITEVFRADVVGPGSADVAQLRPHMDLQGCPFWAAQVATR